ncbi:MAG: hypothetical protein JWM11_4321 [Planctomycetaceae bacterium]|nr:hypothetical protein [Planctomycetaceae bacterium]
MCAKATIKSSPPAEKNVKKKSSFALVGGEVFSIPIGPLGYCTGVVSRPAQLETGLIHVYLRLENTLTPISPDTLGLPHTWPTAWIGLLTIKSLASGRWPIVGRLKDFDRDGFPIPPTRHACNSTGKSGAPDDLFSVETTLNEPSLSPIANVAVTEAEAAKFPPLNIIIAGSSLEKSLVRYFRKMGFTFHDVPVDGFVVRPDQVAQWNAHAKAARSATDPAFAKLLPPGSKTDRCANAGDWFAFPMVGGGFGAAIMIERPDKHLRVFADSFMLSMARYWDRWPTLDDVKHLQADDGAILRQMSLIDVRDGRWRGLGPHPHFNKADWPWPLSWEICDHDHPDTNKAVVQLNIDQDDYRYALVEREILALDPRAGDTMSVMSGGDTIAWSTYQVIHDIHTVDYAGQEDVGIVTPERIAAWKKINPIMLAAMQRAVKNEKQAT